MRKIIGPAFALAVLISALPSTFAAQTGRHLAGDYSAVPDTRTGKAGGHLAGDYVEARTASVFAGACHYNGELTTTGRDAVLAWKVREGAWDGVSLSGLSAVAAVTSDSNLGDGAAARRSVLTVDAKATPAQRDALAAALRATCGNALGTVVSVKSAPVSFARKGEVYHVSAGDFARLDVEAMPDRACCTQPNLVWYKPLVPLSNRRVGYTQDSAVNAPALGAEWAKNGQNTAFYGTFVL